ncbi:MAG: xanthine dehydrogenase family protein molybdopterin-binding subunit [Reyranella sp.]|uniref:xanthine dehydrogenase family protein molybdopterin-binding subunit n=1 Tax=Reyranella sp. TaxID=1929291 RepID=UPI001AD29A40|nr:xanthine dehydrogenase family protein molybdopterin-binding subunit [Reyranella sp.]MBN9091322.1 xanthine dehydrogenase family protein molybdopterin-binding subunit [Reyranella sp.]
MNRSVIGDSPRRREDARFVTGRGAYVDDLKFDGLSRAVFVRSPHAHARIRAIDARAAKTAPGVLAVLTAADATADGLKWLRPYAEANVQTGERFLFDEQPLLAANKVRFMGETVAMVVAETLAQALDASELVEIDYEALPAVTTAKAAVAAAAPLLSPEVPGNVCMDWRTGDAAGADAAFARAAHVVTMELDNHRVTTNPIEPRGSVGTFDPAEGRYTLHISSQNIHINRNHAARCLGVEPKDVRFIAPDVGGGFGAKNFIYAEHILAAWAARKVGRPVKWIATRSEVFLADHPSRDMQASASLALDASGKFLALKVASLANVGAYLAGVGGGVPTYQYVHLQGTVYRLPSIALHVRVVLTNTTPIGVMRGPGFAETVNILERLIDAAALRFGFDRAELRRRNMVPASEMPMTNSFGFEVDSGAFPETMDKALTHADIAGFAARRQESESRGLRRGLGFAYHIKGTGGSPEENVDIRFETDGTVSLITGTQHIGQGHETTFPQILATRLGVPNEQIKLRQGDTDLIATGGGHGSSRATYMGGTAMWRASDEIIQKGTALAADILEASEADIRFEDGRFVVSGTDRAVGLLEVAAFGREKGKPLDTYHFWKREHLTFPNGTHVVEVEVDPETGRVTLERYSGVDDYGVLVNPMVVAGQAHGAMAQGIGQALLEHSTYDADSGQMVAGTFMDYAMPRADDLPSFDLGFNNTRCTTNPLGVKGCGEAGAIAAFPAIANAILDALAPLGVKNFDGPATPSHIWHAIHTATS